MIRHALTVAARQSRRSMELRAGVSPARLLRDTDRKAEAHSLLAPVYSTFIEGFARPDLQAAKALLAEFD
jgi:predicted ATPase